MNRADGQPGMGPSRIWPWCGGAALLAGAFVLSCRLLAFATLPDADPGGRSVAAAVLGNSRLGLSAHFYETADLYFHRGVAHATKRAFTDDPFQVARDRLKPSDHLHAQGIAVQEIMPWLWLAIRLDPGNLETYLVAAFWLAKDVGRIDLAHDVLRQAQWAVPFSHPVQLERARLFLKESRLAEAKAALDAGLAFWPGDGNPEADAARYDRAALLLYRALLHEVDGERAEAVTALREILAMYPGRTALHDRIQVLERGAAPSLLATAYLRDTLAQDDDRFACARGDKHDDPDGGQHACGHADAHDDHECGQHAPEAGAAH